jgi:hypothetical protein
MGAESQDTGARFSWWSPKCTNPTRPRKSRNADRTMRMTLSGILATTFHVVIESLLHEMASNVRSLQNWGPTNIPPTAAGPWKDST